MRADLVAAVGTSGDRARVGRRVGASAIDGFLLTLILITGAEFLGGTGIGVAALVVAAGLYSLVEGFTGHSTGKLMLGLRIRSVDGTNPPRYRLLGRWALKNGGYVSGCLGIATKTGGVSYLALFWALAIALGGLLAIGSKGQALHDRLQRTAVFRV